MDWVFGSFYGASERRYGQSAYAKDYVAVNGPAVTDFLRAVTGIPDLVWSGSRPLAGHPDTEELFFSDLDYDFEQLAFFGEASVAVTDRLSVTGGLRWYDFDEERTQVFDGLFADPLDSTGTTSASGIGFLNGRWDIAFFVDNVTDERALLALDQERGTLARVGYLTNRPRSFGVSTRIDFWALSTVAAWRSHRPMMENRQVIPTLESVAGCLATTDMLMPLVLGDLTDELARRRARDGDGPSIAWEVGHMLDYRCQLIGLLGTPRASPFDVAFATSSATDGAEYPSVAELRRHWHEIAADLQAALEGASDATVRAALESGPHAGQSVLGTVAFFTFHEAYHMGALGAIRKAMGLPGPAELAMARMNG